MIGESKWWTGCAPKFSSLKLKPSYIIKLLAMICFLSTIYVIAYYIYVKEKMELTRKILPVSVTNGDLRKSKEYVYEPLRAGNSLKQVPNSIRKLNSGLDNEFEKQWLRIQKDRVDWKQILAPCANNTILNQTLPGWGKENRTSLRTSYFDYIDVRPAGQFSRFFIKTKTNDGRNKTIGGDFWKVIVKQTL